MEVDLKNSRTNPRRKIRIPILCWESEENRKTGLGKEIVSNDLSTGGIGFCSKKIYPIDTILIIDIFLPGTEKPLNFKIRVAHIEAQVNSDDFIVGTEFINITEEQKEALSAAIGSMNIYTILEKALSFKASDIHLTVGKPPMLRCDGRIVAMKSSIIKAGQVEAMMYPLLTQAQIEYFETNKELDFAFSPSIDSRFRVNLHWQRGFVEAALRNIPTKTKSLEQVGVPVEILKRLCAHDSGLILIAGTTGSGKTTTMSAMINYINENKQGVIITIEDPVEYTLKSVRCVVKQRELGSDTGSYAEALKRVLRQDPDVICVGELLDGESLLAAMRAAETGHLVISTVHAPGAIQTLERVLSFFPPEHSMNICQQLSSSLVGVLYQKLVPSVSGGRVMASEFIKNNNALRNLIREGKFSVMNNVQQTGRSEGMYTFNACLEALVQAGQITPEVAAEHKR